MGRGWRAGSRRRPRGCRRRPPRRRGFRAINAPRLAPAESSKQLEKKLDEMSRRVDEMHKEWRTAVDMLKQMQSNLPAVREAIPAPQIEPPKTGASAE